MTNLEDLESFQVKERSKKMNRLDPPTSWLLLLRNEERGSR
jgi:hypothetical protein